jgi:hypothetical protein
MIHCRALGAAMLTVIAALAGCGGGSPPATADGSPVADAGDASVPTDSAGGSALAELIRRYEAAEISRAQLTEAVAALPPSPGTDPLPALIDDHVLLQARRTGYAIAGNLEVGPRGALVIAGGADVTIGAGVAVTVKGKLYVLGSQAAPVTIAGAGRTALYRTIELAGSGRSEVVGARMRWAQTLISVTGTGTTPILIEDCDLDSFTLSGVEMVMADGLVIRKNRIGVQTMPQDATCEALHGSQSAVRIEDNVFGRRAGYNDVFDLQPCKAPHNPIIFNNRFLGGDDDAIDLDDCDAIIVSNHLKDFRPGPTAAGMANGGGITGAGGNAVLINNVVENCVHAIGFKDDARPVILNNTVIGNDIGITMYSAAMLPAARGIAINNVFWNNKTDVILNGSWYPAYNPTLTGALEASHNVVNDPAFTGRDDNLADDPLIDVRDGVPFLRVGSPARGSGLGDPSVLMGKIPVTLEALRAWLAKDYRGQPRPAGAGVDRGAVQNQ